MSRHDNPNAHLTAKERDRPSFPTRKLLGLGHIEGRVLDYGCGHGADVEFLRSKGFDVEGYDPHYAPERPDGTFDTILCQYVLNVLMQREQTDVLMEVSELLRSSGAAFYSVRRDLRREGFRRHYKHGVPTYQTNVRLPFESILRTKFCEIYRYRPYPQLDIDGSTDCPFCSPSTNSTLVTESAQAYALSDKYPVTDGHTLVLPKRHVNNYFELSEREQTACQIMVNRVQSRLQDKHAPDGFNVGLNVGTDAGQTVPHAHIHVIPRYAGDVDDPTGGVRNVIPEKGNYLSGAVEDS
jgi:diadenosine tetraphosphate (Ap4A) HIT family hydrolase